MSAKERNPFSPYERLAAGSGDVAGGGAISPPCEPPRHFPIDHVAVSAANRQCVVHNGRQAGPGRTAPMLPPEAKMPITSITSITRLRNDKQ